MAAPHDPPETFRFNKLRTTGGSTRLTVVKEAVEGAGIEPRPPRPELAHLPAAPGVWLALDVERYPSQTDRVAIRSAVSDRFPTGEPLVGEFPVELQGKLGSAVTLVPRQLVDRADLEPGERVTAVALHPGALLFLTRTVVEADPDGPAAAIRAARETIE